MTNTYRTKISSNSYTEIIQKNDYNSKKPEWCDGLVTGNGENGVICSCSPYSETFIYQNLYFIMPTIDPRFIPPEVTDELHEARQAVIKFDDTWNVHGRVRPYLYRFHPGHQLRLNIHREEVMEYTRETLYETAEIILKYSDKNGKWTRRTFTSREDNVTITQISKSDKGAKINVDISIDDVSCMRKFCKDIYRNTCGEKNMQYKRLVDEECSYISMVAHYPSFDGSELAEGGYAGVTRVIAIGGMKKKVIGKDSKESINVGNENNPILRITGADEVYLITKASRTHHMGELCGFKAEDKYEIIDNLLSDIGIVIGKHTDRNGNFSYESALEPHMKKQSRLYSSVSFSLGKDIGKESNNELLIKKQKYSKDLMDEFVERAYNHGRYIQVCCSGQSAPRLCGLWTGEWNPGWSGSYTMDANVNIQVSGMNTGNIYDAAIGYIYFVLRQIKDWEENAVMVYSMKDAILIPVNTDGDRAIMIEYDQDYPFQYWNAGASWVLLPIYEFWQCFGNCKIPVNDKINHIFKQEYLDLEKDVLYPLLKKQANFWEQLCTPEYFTDINGNARYEKGKKALLPGEKYVIIPSYSPENKPKKYNSTITANATMDISAARDGLKMMIDMEKALAYKGFNKEVKRWENLMDSLPKYKFDKTGALCEWAMNEYEENNEHRHISHLYCAWPAYETQNDEKLVSACNTVIANRNKENTGKDDASSHGWVHKTLVAARLKNGECVYDMLYKIMSSDIYYTPFMTDHDIDKGRGVYCTDMILGTVGIINEMLLYSNTGEIELLPALPAKWRKGFINGLMARTRAQVTKLEWNIDEGRVMANILSNCAQSIRIGCRVGKGTFFASDGMEYAIGDEVRFENGEEKTVIICF